jgi:hypothetical protein
MQEFSESIPIDLSINWGNVKATANKVRGIEEDMGTVPVKFVDIPSYTILGSH